MNNISQPIAEIPHDRPITTLSIVRTAVYCVIFSLGVVGNTIVLIALNLTISDLLFIVCLTSDVYIELAISPYNTFFSKALRPLSTVMFSASIFTMTTTALERHHVITKPFHLRMGRSRTLLVIGAIWVLSVAFAVPLPILTTAGVIECRESG